uniref:Tetratricopeptide repeat protein n=1 Tax=Pseudothermotoga hypogea TaxID=57487 RepID=A0A832IAL8_9THEM
MDKLDEHLSDGLFEQTGDNEILNVVGLLLIFNEHFEEAFAVLKYNYEKHKNEMAKRYIDDFDYIKAYINDFNMSLEFVTKRKYKSAYRIMKSYYEKGFLTISGIKLFTICLVKLRKHRELKEFSERMGQLAPDLAVFFEYERYLDRRIAYLLLTIPAVFFGIYLGSLNPGSLNLSNVGKMNKPTYTEPQTQKEVVYKVEYVQDPSGETIKEALGNDLGRLLYAAGLEMFRKGNYQKSYEYFNLADKFLGESSYLRQHTVYFLAESSNRLGREESASYYIRYATEYENGCYYDEVLYNLALMLYEKHQYELAAEYASKIRRDSIFFNSKIKKILGGEK